MAQQENMTLNINKCELMKEINSNFTYKKNHRLLLLFISKVFPTVLEKYLIKNYWQRNRKLNKTIMPLINLVGNLGSLIL